VEQRQHLIRVSVITFLNYIVSGALTLLIPLLLLNRNMNVAEIGMVLSILPLVFLIARLFFAAVADYVGWSHIFLLVNWPSTAASIIIYYFANSVPIFFGGKILEGLRESSYWAVIRTAIYQLSPQKAGKEAIKNNAIIWLATAAGGAFAGLSIAYIGFSTSLAILAFISLAIGIPAIMLWKSSTKTPIPKDQKIFSSLNPKGRTRLFWIGSITLMFGSLSVYPLISLLLPVFMSQQLGYDYVSIGLLFLLYNLVSAIATFFSIKRPLNLGRAISLTLLSVVASAFLVYSNYAFVMGILTIAFVRGYGIGFFEYTIVKVTRNSKNICVDIGFIHVPQRIAEFASVLTAGFLAQIFGYLPVFITLGSFFGFYSLLALYVINKKVPDN
jgi:MFS family permease